MEDETETNELRIPTNKRQEDMHQQNVWRALSLPNTEKSLQNRWFVEIYEASHGNKKEQMYVGKLTKRFLDDENGAVTLIEMDCLKPPTGIMEKTTLKSVPEHLRNIGDHLAIFQRKNIIAGPVSVIFERGQKWHVPELLKLKKIFSAFNKFD